MFASVLLASQFGWEIGVHAYLVPYENTKKNTYECQLVPGWQGLVDLASRSGRAAVWTGAVFEGDEFDFALGDSPFIRHKPLALEESVDKLQYVYAVGRTGQWPVVEVWPVAKVKAHRDRYNRQGQKHYSFQHLEMYGRKVALLQVLKYMPKSVELQSAIQLEHEAEGGEQNYSSSGFIELPELVSPTEEAASPAPADPLPEEEKKQTTTEAVKEELKKGKKPADEIWPKREKKKEGTKDDDTLPF